MLNKSINQDALIIIIGKILQIAIAIISMRIMTEILSPEEFGRLGIMIAIFMFIGFFLTNPVGMYIYRHLLEWNQTGEAQSYLSYFVIYIFITAAISALSVFLISQLIGLGISITSTWLITLVFLYIITNTINTTSISYLNLLNNRLMFVILTVSTIIITLILSIVLSKTSHPNMEYWLAGQILGFGLIAILGYYFLFNKLKSTIQSAMVINSSTLYPIFIFAFPLAVSTGLNWIQLQSYKFILANSEGLTIVGLFIAGYGISAAIIAAFESIMLQYYMPIFYKEIANVTSQEQSKAWRKYSTLLIPALIITVIFIIFAGPYLMKILLSNKFQSVQVFIIWGALIEGLRVLGNCISMGAHALVNTKILLLPNAIGAISSIILLLMLPNFMESTLAVGLSLTLAGMIFIITLFTYLNQYIKLEIRIRPILIAVILSTPIMILFGFLKIIVIDSNLAINLIILSVAGLYYMLAQFIIYSKWRKSN